MMKRLPTVLFLAVLFQGCTTSLTVLHVNDTHSHHEPVRAGEYAGQGGIIERGAIVDSVIRADGRRNVLLLHAGDFNQGTSYFNALGGEVELQALNAFRYDALTLGNHEFDNGLENLAGRLSRANCPVVCANVDFSGTPLEGLVRPYVVVRKAGRKIGIVGVCPEMASVVMAEIAQSIRQRELVGTVQGCVDELRAKKKCDLVILLTHIGYEEDLDLASRITGADFIVGGHSHTVVSDIEWVPAPDGREVGVITDGMWGFTVGCLKIL